MTKLLQEAFERIAALPEEDQDRIALQLIDELEDDARWDGLFAESQDPLRQMGEKARDDFRAGRTRPLDPGAL